MSTIEKQKTYDLVKEKFALECQRFEESVRTQEEQGASHLDVVAFKRSIFRMLHPNPDERISLKETAVLLNRVFEDT